MPIYCWAFILGAWILHFTAVLGKDSWSISGIILAHFNIHILALPRYSSWRKGDSLLLAKNASLEWGTRSPLVNITLSLESASQGSSTAYWSWRLITLIWSHTRQFVISFITTVTIHYSFSLPLQAQNSSFSQILFSAVLLPFHPLDWLHRLQLFFVFLGHVGFNLGTVC